jgi:hypothetical protein
MEYAVLEPSVISISPEEWSCEMHRDDYLEHFHSILKSIDSSQDIYIAWSEESDELIWSDPQRPPWTQDRTWSNTIIPIIYKAMQTNFDYIEAVDKSLECEITPSFVCTRSDLTKNFKNVLGHLHDKCDGILIPLGLKNIPSEDRQFKVGGCNLIPPPKLISCTKDFLDQIKVEESFWPNCSSDGELLKKGVSILLKRNHDINCCNVEFDFSKTFVKKLSSTQESRLRILELIAKRLSKTTAESGRDPVLQDENVEGRSDNAKERRFRVTPRPSSKRIHYNFEGSKIVFIMFYDSGEHDDGL